MARSAGENVEPRKCGQRERKMCLHGFYHRRVFRGYEVTVRIALREVRLTARGARSDQVSDRALSELENQERRDTEKLARKNQKLKMSWRRLRKRLRSLKAMCEGTERVKALSADR